MGLRTGVALALLGAAPAATAVAGDAPAGMEAQKGALRHTASGLVVPDRIGGMRRFLTGSTGFTALYMDLNMMKPKAVILGAIAQEHAQSFAEMRENARGAFHETGVPEVIEESTFRWPGHPDAATFHGRYTVGPYRKDLWRAWDKGWDVNVIVTTPRGDEKAMTKISAQVAQEVFGGATIPGAAPAG